MLYQTNRRTRWLIFVSLIVLQAFLSLGSKQMLCVITYMFSSSHMNQIEITASHELPDFELMSVDSIEVEDIASQDINLLVNEQSMSKVQMGQSVQAMDEPASSTVIRIEDGVDSTQTNSLIMPSISMSEVSIASVSEQAPSYETEDKQVIFDEAVIAEQYESVAVTATGYYAGPRSTGKDHNHPEYGITYSGIKVLRDRDAISTIAADISIFPLGTILYIPDYGYGIVADTGSAVKGMIIDLYFDTLEDVYDQWGKKELDVYIIEKGEGKITDDMFNQVQMIYKKV